MRASVVCVDGNASRSIDRRQILEDAGFTVLGARHESDALAFLRSHPVDVVCVASPCGSAETDVGRRIKHLRPDIPLILIRNAAAVPPRFEEYVDIVITEPEFERIAEWLIEELHDSQSLFFVRWFVDWIRRPAELRTEQSVPIC